MLKKIALFVLFVLLFVVGKIIFMAYYGEIFGAYTLGERAAALWHGLPHDLTCAGYLMALPFVAHIFYVWFRGEWHRHFIAHVALFTE